MKLRFGNKSRIVAASILVVAVSSTVTFAALSSTVVRKQEARSFLTEAPKEEKEEPKQEVTAQETSQVPAQSVAPPPVTPVQAPVSQPSTTDYAKANFLSARLVANLSEGNKAVAWQCFETAMQLLKDRDPTFPSWDNMATVQKVTGVSASLYNPCSPSASDNYIADGRTIATYVLTKYCILTAEGHLSYPLQCSW